MILPAISEVHTISCSIHAIPCYGGTIIRAALPYQDRIPRWPGFTLSTPALGAPHTFTKGAINDWQDERTVGVGVRMVPMGFRCDTDSKTCDSLGGGVVFRGGDAKVQVKSSYVQSNRLQTAFTASPITCASTRYLLRQTVEGHAAFPGDDRMMDDKFMPGDAISTLKGAK